MPANDLLLVTGGSGFVSSHCIVALRKQSDRVRTPIRASSRTDDVREMLKGWVEACRDCTYVLNIASPFPAAAPKHEDALVVPARDGTLRAPRAAKAAGPR
ncbi:hypothetical protein LTR53_016498 [Teratosphaeriaceae sp. CCFEE 6253]|nr:hypothetical protein LTR53_016498 [Teratosphaeriaceae sp. CCFEE 6253]